MYVCSEKSDTSQMEKLILYAGDETVGLAMGVVRSLRSVESWGVALPSQVNSTLAEQQHARRQKIQRCTY